MIIDCRRFNWPRGRKGHPGEEEWSIKSVVDHSDFPEWLGQVKRLWMKVAKSRVIDAPNMPFMCKAGINRSVSCCRIVGEIFRKEGFDTAIEHSGREFWTVCRKLCPANANGKCKFCRSGKGSTNLKAKSLAKAYDIWTKV